ncbi:MAG: hypothetical protein HXX16_10575 [Bacteroidales bacterium]|nr:hypothetical protein [Bacteroidales bacterium]
MKKISLSEIEVNDLLDLYQSEIDRAQRRINNLKTIINKLSEGQSIETLEEKPVKVKGKRGRKPSIRPVEVNVISEIKDKKGKVIEVESRKRGRKKKVEEVNAAPQKGMVVEAREIPKKRGRKKKIVEINAVPEVRGEKVVKTKATIEKKEKKKVAKVKAIPKKRGRKPKSVRKPIKGGKGENKVKWNDFIIETITSKDSMMLASSITQAALEKFQIPSNDRDRVRMAISTTLTKMANKDKVLQTYSQKGIRGAFFGLTSWFNGNSEPINDYKKKLM